MSMTTTERQKAAIVAAFRGLGVLVTPVGPLRWSSSVPAWPTRVSARLDGDWLLLESALPEETERWTPWDLLRWNRSFAGPGKFALRPDGRPGIRAELPLEDPSVLPGRLRGWCADLASAARLLAGREGVARPVSPDAREAAGEGASALELLGPTCAAAGWSFTERSASQLRVALDLPEGYHQACIDLHPDGALRVSVELASFDHPSRISRRALGILLLGASGMVRLVRGALLADGEAEATGLFEVRFTLPLAAGELHHALSALATAARLCGREVAALRCAPLAMTYLKVREPGSDEIRLTEAKPQENQEALHATE
jgi:hypothetical protein